MSDILNARIVRVRFSDGNNDQEYAYFTDDASIGVDDLVVVMPPKGLPKVVKVSSVSETVESIQRVREWIICKIDLTAYKARKTAEEKRALLRAKIERAKAEAIAAIDLTDLAGRSPALAALIAEYNQI